MKLENKLSILLLLFFSFVLFRFFLSTSSFVAHDWPLLFSKSRDFHPFWSIAWDYMGSGGIGSSAFKTLWIDLYANFVYFISNLINMPWWLSQRIFWIAPFIILSLFSSYIFSGLFIKNPTLRVLSSIIYTFNTYILLIVGGGQFGIALAYALSPLVFFVFIKLFRKTTLGLVLLSGFLFGVLIALDPRISLLVLSAMAFWFLAFERKESIKKIKNLIPVFTISALLNSYWILPIITSQNSASTFSGYFSSEGAKFLSFATLTDSLSFLHPNWPENIFGKIYFFRAEFLVIPILVFANLFLKPRKEILFFIALSLFSVFLAKGASEPFGNFYLFLFENVPGFGLFRDSTKFYILIAISYSVLIPYFFENFSKRIRYVLVGAFIVYFLILLRPALQGELTGIFNPKQIPQDYINFKEELSKDKSFYRTLWIPQRQKYGYFDPSHPAINAKDFFKTTNYSQILKKMRMDEVQKALEETSVRYVIVPTDADGEIFLKDRKYDPKQYALTVDALNKLSWLKRNDQFGNLAIYETIGFKDHFFTLSKTTKIDYRFNNPTKYEVDSKEVGKGDILIFSEGYNPNWVLRGGDKEVSSKPYGSLNSFTLPENEGKFTIYFKPQKWVDIGVLLSLGIFVGVFSLLVFGKLARKW